MNIIDRLEQLAAMWRTRARQIEAKYEPINPGQTQVAVECLTARADELEMIVKEARDAQ